ncbi:adenosylcobinamide-phosphate synthase CbiB [Desulfopila aestuarii]|uniref:Cobalamin biosynthesis protein CobD n=1 Tax=Desulfopila aestuarii DSM 18488 TaxID=1121416 RepID=A0A1M7YBV6_9BACT|nr:adenosylcobinamide-phosphate synthase CbiB [Desulfopila aestuarii]SHO50120.1 adenosylcobinamide-phosphate synthase [Desulfopila aestuarii DSM 18488]
MIITLQFLAALCLDLLIGDPKSIPHPVQGIGWLCATYEDRARKVFVSPGLAGVVSTLLVLGSTLLVLGIVLMLLHKISPVLESLVAVVLLSSSIACRGLYDHSIRVYQVLISGEGIDAARREVAKIVGRDTAELDKHGVCRACVETVAENLVDGITAPLFFAFLASLIPGGELLSQISLALLGAYFYKAINTMDSMYGYKNDRYLHFGRTAALVDDLVNFLPARLSGLALVAAAWMLRMDAARGLKIFLRDRHNHASPNSGHPEAAVAGILGVQLGGNSSYFGSIVKKPTMGEALRTLVPADIVLVNKLMFTASALFGLLLLASRLMIIGG